MHTITIKNASDVAQKINIFNGEEGNHPFVHVYISTGIVYELTYEELKELIRQKGLTISCSEATVNTIANKMPIAVKTMNKSGEIEKAYPIYLLTDIYKLRHILTSGKLLNPLFISEKTRLVIELEANGIINIVLMEPSVTENGCNAIQDNHANAGYGNYNAQ